MGIRMSSTMSEMNARLRPQKIAGTPLTHRFPLVALILSLTLGLAACATPEVARGVNDPYEAENRQRHQINRDLDQYLLKPTSGAYGAVLPEPVRQGVSNFATNLGLPSVILNNLLQGKIDDAAHNSVRFLFNSTIGLGGLIDIGTNNGLDLRDSDFGETLYVWGAREGPYLEMPVIGPTTTRDFFGKVVDTVIDPVGWTLKSPERYIPTIASTASRVGDRYRFSDTVDSVLYESADSYTQARLLFLENRRFELGATTQDDIYDQYEALYD